MKGASLYTHATLWPRWIQRWHTGCSCPHATFDLRHGLQAAFFCCEPGLLAPAGSMTFRSLVLRVQRVQRKVYRRRNSVGVGVSRRTGLCRQFHSANYTSSGKRGPATSPLTTTYFFVVLLQYLRIRQIPCRYFCTSRSAIGSYKMTSRGSGWSSTDLILSAVI